MRQIKTPILMAITVLATMAVCASSASAAVEFHTSSPGAAIGSEATGTPEAFKVQGSEASCKTAKWKGTFPEAKSSPSLELHPEYSGCKAFGFPEATVNTAGCQEKFYAATGAFDLSSCTSGGILITAGDESGKCVVEIPDQAGISEFSLSATQLFLLLMLLWIATHPPGKVVTSTGTCPLKTGATELTLTGGPELFANSKTAELWVE
jgi:hypothetical protein